jgi:hypothetical protein
LGLKDFTIMQPTNWGDAANCKATPQPNEISIGSTQLWNPKSRCHHRSINSVSARCNNEKRSFTLVSIYFENNGGSDLPNFNLEDIRGINSSSCGIR